MRLKSVLIVGALALGCTTVGEEVPPEPTTASPTTEAAIATTATTQTTQAPATAPAAPVDPENAQEMAQRLAEAERTIRLAETSPQDANHWGQQQQRFYRILANNPEWAPKVIELIAASDPDLGFAVEQNWAARQELSSLVTSGSLSDTLPAWRIRDPLPAVELLGHYQAAEANTGIGWEYLAAINLVETRMGRIEGLSTAGATGPMQFLPSTWEECCEGDPTVDADAIRGAAVFLTITGGPEDMSRALRRYNNSDYYVNAVSAYASVLQNDPAAYRGYHAWQVYFRSSAGLIVMPTGYEETEPVGAAAWLEAHPQALVG